jgi:hypothetical protein
MKTKAFWTSKTVWTGVLLIALGLAEVLPASHWTQVVLGGVIIVLRLITNASLSRK